MHVIKSFEDLFSVNDENRTITPRQTIRLGAMLINSDHALSLDDDGLGFPLSDWVDKSFEVLEDGDQLTIIRLVI